jgi:hypothetical protein
MRNPELRRKMLNATVLDYYKRAQRGGVDGDHTA